jgi:hypothetical protein
MFLSIKFDESNEWLSMIFTLYGSNKTSNSI